MKTKKLISVMLLICVVLSVLSALSALSIFSSCAKNDAAAPTQNNAGDSDNSPADNFGNVTETPTEESFDPGLPEADYGNYLFRILNITQADMWWAIVDADITEQTGEVVEDAIYLRNRNIEDRYKFLIKEIRMSRSALTTAVKKSVGSGGDDYDVALPYISDIPGLVQNNLLVDLKKVPHLDFNKPWWTNDVSRYFSIGNKLVFSMSDILLTDNDDVVITMYNKKMAEDLGLDGADALYNLVDQGKWTFDKFAELTKAAWADLNGNGKVDPKEDRFGLVCVSWLYNALIGGFDEYLVSKDENDLPYLSCKSESFLRAYQTMAEFMSNREWVVREGDDSIGGTGRTEEVFVNDRALMCIQVLSCCRLYREMGSDFGILPMPKLDENQAKYCSYMCGSTCISIPKTNNNLDRTGLILEALSAESRRLVIPAYYDVALSAKYLRDERSYDMLDIILDNRVYDICGAIYDWGGFTGQVAALAKKNDPNFASLIEKNEGKVLTAMKKTIEAYEAVE